MTGYVKKPTPSSKKYYFGLFLNNNIFEAVNLRVSLRACKRALYSVTPTVKHLLTI